ncbi:CCA tRNA nucleotidyltransferase 1, mitochondrial [Holospora obtusa F1]|uniref:CCA tRNA nucleotidyltransferase 1, mitochondrial n=1 Tax=Holospora obtusa F1 TaxID=1399147 RepID=W6TF51_HOLOB|nr:CCA tRNA nucleotidyltransferase 1, mitochondrial [Holospora obtusa F1]
MLGIALKDDFDLAISCPPDLTMRFLQESNILSIPTGIKHGTISAIVEGILYEITTLRTECNHDGRHASVEFTHDWAGDAARRDFTMNALYVDEQGKIFDTVQGQEDLAQGIVRFIGDPDARIQEDYLRILRFFRIHAYYGKGDLNTQDFSSCCRWKHMLSILSKERITKEFFKLLEAPNPWYVIEKMISSGILSQILQTRLSFVSTEELEQCSGYNPGPLVRWATLTEYPCPGLRLSKKQERTFSALHIPLNFQHIKESLYAQDVSIVLGRCWLTCVKNFKNSKTQFLENWCQYSEQISSFVPVFFPLNGNVLLDNGVTSQHIGKILNHVKQWWIKHDEKPSSLECLAYALNIEKTMLK